VEYTNGFNTFTRHFNNIESLDNEIIMKLKLMQFSPKFRFAQKDVRLGHIIPDKDIIKTLNDKGIKIKYINFNFQIIDYIKLLKFIFPEYEIIDFQTSHIKGHPDFKLRKGVHTFYIEMKTSTDGIRKSQLDWMFRNIDKEVYFLFIDEK